MTYSRPSFLIALHYDHAPDKDDGHSAAADRSLLETEFGCAFIRDRTLAVGGTYNPAGNGRSYQRGSEEVSDAAFNGCGGQPGSGWINAAPTVSTASATERTRAFQAACQVVAARWTAELEAGRDIWVKEGGQSDLTACVVRAVKAALPGFRATGALKARIVVVQHSRWNEDQTADAELAYVERETDYRTFRSQDLVDGNGALKTTTATEVSFFRSRCEAEPRYGGVWREAFEYYRNIVDFSDTTELFYILTRPPKGSRFAPPVNVRGFAEKYCEGTTGETPRLTGLDLIDMTSGVLVAGVDGQAVTAPFTPFSVRANPGPGVVRVVFSGVVSRTENVAPFVATGDTDGHVSSPLKRKGEVCATGFTSTGAGTATVCTTIR